MSKPIKIIIGVCLISTVGAAVAYAMWPEPEPEVDEDTDTGLNREQVEEMMRSIGYVQ